MTDLYVLYFYMVFLNKADFLSKLSSSQHKMFFFLIQRGNRDVPQYVCYVFCCILETTQMQYNVGICVMLLSLCLPLHFYVNLNYEIVFLE